MMRVIPLAEKRVLIDSSLRFGIWKLLKQRLKEEFATDVEQQNNEKTRLT